MRKYLLIYSVVILLKQGRYVYAQALSKGERLPIERFNNAWNYPASILDLKSFQPKLYVLDFWETNCAGCIQSFPKIQALQQKYGKAVQFIMVNKSSRDSTAHFFAKRSKLVVPPVPFITGDTVLCKLFPVDGVPYAVWLDQTLEVVAVTGGASVNAAIIENFLNQSSSIPINEPGLGRKYIDPVINNAYASKLKYCTYLSGWIPGSQKGIPDSVKLHSKVIEFKSATIEKLYVTAYSMGGVYDYGRVGRFEIDLAQPEQIKKPAVLNDPVKWAKDHLYTYWAMVPKEKAGKIYEYMKQDLHRYFGYKVIEVLKERVCIVLEREPKEISIVTKGQQPIHSFMRSTAQDGDIKDSIRTLRNMDYSFFTRNLGSWIETVYQVPFVDSTGLSGKIDIALSAVAVESLRLDVLNTELSRYGLRLTKKNATIKTLILCDEKKDGL